MKKFHTVSIVLGIFLLGALIWQIGPGRLWRELGLLGWGLVPIILIEGLADVFHTIGWRHCLVGQQRSLSFYTLFRIRMAGFSINHLTPTASLGGEVTKGALLSMEHRGSDAAAGVIIGKLAYAMAQLLFVVGGSLVILGSISLPTHIWVLMLTGTVLLGGGIFAFLVVQKYGKLGALVRWLSARGVGGKALARLSSRLSEVDRGLCEFYRRHPGDLPKAMLWHMVGMSIGVLQSWYFLYLLTDRASLMLAAGIGFLGGWLDLLAFPLVTNVGVLEATRVIVFRTLGFNAALGLTFGIALRLEQVFWAGVGLLMYGSLISGKRGGESLGVAHDC